MALHRRRPLAPHRRRRRRLGGGDRLPSQVSGHPLGIASRSAYGIRPRGLRWNGQLLEVAMPGPAPKPPSQRRRRNTPASYGAAEPTTAPAADPAIRELGIDNPHPLITAMWTRRANLLRGNVLQRRRLGAAPAWNCGSPTGSWPAGSRPRQAWAVIQHGLYRAADLPGDQTQDRHRSCGRAVDDPDADAAVAMIGRYRQSLKPV